MNNSMRRECELKYKILNEEVKNKLYKIIRQNGYTCSKSVLQTDIILDTNEYLCKKNNILFRFREEVDINTKDVFFLVTIKIKGISKEVQDNYEIEFIIDGYYNKSHDLAINELEKVTLTKLPSDIFVDKSIENIIFRLFESGFIKYSILQKKRKYYKGNGSPIMFDVFPDSIGMFLEIESSNVNELYNTIELLDLRREKMEKRTYGKIVLEKNQMCVFDKQFLMNSMLGYNLDFCDLVKSIAKRYRNCKE